MPFVQRVIEPKYLSRTSLLDADGKPLVSDDELEAVTNNTLTYALRQLASLVLVANDIFTELGGELQKITERSEKLKTKINTVEEKVSNFDPKKVAVPESDIASFALLKEHYHAKHEYHTDLFKPHTRPNAVKQLYDAAAKTPIYLMRQMDRWRRDGHRSSRFFMCTPVLGAKRRRIRGRIDIDIETRMPAVVEELRRWTSSEALGDITVSADGPTRILSSTVATDGDNTDGTVLSDDEGIDHKLPSPEEQLQVVALKYPAEIVAVDISGKCFDRMSMQRRSLMTGDIDNQQDDGSTLRRRGRSRKPRNKRRNTLGSTDQKEIREALTAGEEQTSSVQTVETESPGAVARSKSSDPLRFNKKESPEVKKSHFSTLKQWGRNRLKMIAQYADSKSNDNKSNDIDNINIYETITVKRKRNIDKERKSMHERKPSCSSSEKSSINIPINTPITAAMNIASVRLRDSSAQRRLRRSGGNKDEPHSSSGNWSASSESGRASIGSEFTTTTQPKSTTSATTSNNSLNLHAPSSVNSRRRFNINTSTSGSVTSEGTLTPDIIHDLHEDGETSSVYSCDTEGYYTSFHMDSGLKTLKEEDSPATPLHSTSTFSNSSSNNTVLTAENEYELFGKGSTSTTTSSAGTVCTALRAAESNRSLVIGPVVPERKSSLSKLSNKDKSPESSLERDYSSDKTGTVKRSPAANKATVVAIVHKQIDGDVSPDSGHNTSSSPIESMNSPNGVRSGSEFEFSESSDMEGADRTERIREKTTINSSRIPSMCVITPSQSDDESVKSHNFDDNKINNNINNNDSKDDDKMKINFSIKSYENNNNLNSKVLSQTGNKLQVINVNPQTGYATIENQQMQTITKSSHRAPSPSGGTVIVKESRSKSPQIQPIIKATLLPLNNMIGKLKLNFTNLASRLDNKSPVKSDLDNILDSGDYVTISDVKNNNEKSASSVIYANDIVNRNLKTVLSGKIRETEYISLNELPCNDPEGNLQSPTATSDSLERKKRQGARVTLNAEGKVVYSSDSLKRRKGAHTTFEPGPFVKIHSSPTQSPLASHRIVKHIRPVTQDSKLARGTSVDECQSLSQQLGKVVIKASSGVTSPTSEIVRMPPSTIVSPRPMSPKPNNNTRGAYVHMQEPRIVPDEGRALSPPKQHIYNQMAVHENQFSGYRNTIIDRNTLSRNFESSCSINRGSGMYSTLPNRKPRYNVGASEERSVTPDIMRGLGNKQYNTNSIDRRHRRNEFEGFVEYPPRITHFNNDPIHQNLGIPVQIPQVNIYNQMPFNVYQSSPQNHFSPIHSYNDHSNQSFKVSPIDPRNMGGFHASTPSKVPELRAAANLESKMLSPKKSTMSNEELYAAIHKSKKKMNIQMDELDRGSPVLSNSSLSPVNSENSLSNKNTKPETGYLGDKSKTRLSWSPNSGEYVDFNTNIDKNPPSVDHNRSRLSWACGDKKESQTSRLDFKRLLLLHGKTKINQPAKKMSAVEQLKLSKQQSKSPPPYPPKHESDVSILDLTSSPRNNRNRMTNNPPGSPNRVLDKQRPPPKLLSPRSQWRFANPRSDVLSSTIPEDCHEDESPNTSGEAKSRATADTTNFKNIKQMFEKDLARPIQQQLTATQRLQAQRAQFFNSTPISSPLTRSKFQDYNKPQMNERTKSASPPTLETAF